MIHLNPILVTNALSIGYPVINAPVVVASDINIQLAAGKLISLIGQNGAGKSTLLRTLSGLQQPLNGSISINETDLKHLKPSETSKIFSLVLTDKLPESNLTVFELVALGRQPYTNWIGSFSMEDIHQVEKALDLTQTSHLAQKKHYEISDGQLQKVMIARAIAQDTPLIILDEPSTHLDYLHKISLFSLLSDLASELRKCILFSTHDIEMAIELSDQMILMTEGTAVQGTPEELINDGSFDRLFPTGQVSFDRQKVKFVFNHNIKRS